jgi:hypothetical protein
MMMMNERKRRVVKQPRLTKAKVKMMDANHIPNLEEAWEAYHNAVLVLIEQEASDEDIEEQRNFATCYYEAYLDLLIGTRKK